MVAWLEHAAVPTWVSGSNPDDSRAVLAVGHTWIFRVFLGVLPFPEFHPTNTLHFKSPSPSLSFIPFIIISSTIRYRCQKMVGIRQCRKHVTG